MPRRLLVLLAWIASVSVSHATDAATGIDWEVKHRFRVIVESRHDVFIDHFNSYFRRAAAFRGIDIPTGQRWFFPSPFESDLQTRYRPDRAQYEHGWFHDTARMIAVRLPRRADRARRCVWELDGRQSAEVACNKATSLTTHVGRHELVVRISEPGRATEERRLPIEVKNLSFVAMGDSYASGEGNPHVTFSEASPIRLAEWWDHRCHRSLLAASAQTAVMMAQQRKDTSITYVSYACSGATIDGGVLGGYTGVETAKQAKDRLAAYGPNGGNVPHFRENSIPAQIERARALLCRVEGQTPCLVSAAPDIVTVATGGNELGFGEKVKTCATGRCVFTPAELAPAFERLRGFYRALVLQAGTLGARHILAITYPNMTRRDDGSPCGDSPFNFDRKFVPGLATFLGFGLSRTESRNAERVLLNPLNALIKEEATRAGWTAVDGFQRNKGFCVRPSWFVTVTDADVKQGRIGETNEPQPFVGIFPSGAMHPNVFGHAGIRARLHPEIDRLMPP